MSFSPAFSLPRRRPAVAPDGQRGARGHDARRLREQRRPVGRALDGTGGRAASAGIPSLPLASKAPGDTLADSHHGDDRRRCRDRRRRRPGAVTLVSVKPVTWMDGSLGCPKPGVMYTQSVVPGFRVIVRAGDRKLDYRVGRAGTAKRCDSGTSTGSDG